MYMYKAFCKGGTFIVGVQVAHATLTLGGSSGSAAPGGDGPGGDGPGGDGPGGDGSAFVDLTVDWGWIINNK